MSEAIENVERTILSAVVEARDETEALSQVDSAKPEWFSSPQVSAFWRTMREMQSKDVATLVNALKDHRAFADTTPTQWLAGVVGESSGILSKSKEYVRQIREAHQTRTLIQLGERIARDASDPAKCAVHIAAVEDYVVQDEISHIADGYLDLLDTRLKNQNHDIVPSHLPKLDRVAPFRRGHVGVVAAQTGLGKTTFALNVAKAAAEQGSPALVLSLEMRRQELCDRMVAMLSGVELKAIQRLQGASDGERQKIREGVTQLEDLPVHVVDAFATTPASVLAQCRKHMRTHPFELLVVDYLQLLNPDKPSGNRTVDVAACSRAMKTLANQLNVAVLLVSQFNRTAGEGRPQLRHLKESSSIEQDATTALLLHDEGTEGPMELIVRKNRLGENNLLIDTHFDKPRCTFREAAPLHLEPDSDLAQFDPNWN